MKKFSIYYIKEVYFRLTYTTLGTLLIFFTTYIYKESLIFLVLPQGLSHFVSPHITEIFLTYIQLCTLLTFSLSFILIIFQAFFFLRPGLYLYEAKGFFKVLIIGGSIYITLYLVFFPILLKILWESFSIYYQNFTPIHLSFEPKLSDYLIHIKTLNKLLIFLLPLLLSLNFFQKYTRKQILTKYRSLFYIIIFFIASLLTPPDLLSQVLVGIPTIIFFEIQIIFWTFYRVYLQELNKTKDSLKVS